MVWCGMSSLLLDRTTWDLVLDQGGNIAQATSVYAVLQDVSTAVRTWAGEVIYDTSLGVDYLGSVLGNPHGSVAFTSQATREANNVLGVSKTKITVSGISPTRGISGVAEVTLSSGQTVSIGISA